MAIILEGPRPTIDVVIQDYLKNNWPTTPNVDPTKLQTIVSDIDWGKDYDEQTSQRCTIKVTEIDADRIGRDNSARFLEYLASMVIRIQYRDADDDQPPELWNIGELVASLAHRASVTMALRNNGIHNISVGRFTRNDNVEGLQELHEYTQTIEVGFYKRAKDV